MKSKKHHTLKTKIPTIPFIWKKWLPIGLSSTALLVGAAIFTIKTLYPLHQSKQSITKALKTETQKLRKINRQIAHEKASTSLNTTLFKHYQKLQKNPLQYINKKFITNHHSSRLTIQKIKYIPEKRGRLRLNKEERKRLKKAGISSVTSIKNIVSNTKLLITTQSSFFETGNYLKKINTLPIHFKVVNLKLHPQKDNPKLINMSILMYIYYPK